LPVLVLCYASGLAVGILLPWSAEWLLSIALISAVAGILVRRDSVASLALHTSVVSMGWAVMVLHTGFMAQTDIRQQLNRTREYIDVTGVVISQPQVSIADARGRISWQFDFNIDASYKGSRMQPATGRIRVSMTANEDTPTLEPSYGDRWRLKGVFSVDRRPITRAQGLAGFLSCRMDYARRLETGVGNPLVSICYRMRDHAYERLGWGLGNDRASAALTRALLLGYRQDVPRPVYDAFAQTGTLHILALSGMHVGILILLIVVLLKAVGISRPGWALFFIPFLLVYTVGTGAAASTVRASIMAVVFFSAYMFRRKPDTPTSLALAALLILAMDPIQLFHYGFILSFVVVWGIITIYPVLTRWVRDKTAGDPWADPEISWLSRSSPFWQKIVDMGGISAAAWLASLPLIATIFHVISPIALLVNLILVPLAFVILFAACLSLFAGLVSFEAASVFNHANELFSDILIQVVEWSSRIPGSHVYVPPWSWTLVICWYGLLVLWLARRGWTRIVATCGLAALAIFSMGQRHWSDDVSAIVIQIGDNNVLLIDGPGNHAILIDSGTVYHQRKLVEQLRQRGISRINQVWISRATTDAYGGLTGLLDAVNVDQIVIPNVAPGQQLFQSHRQAWVAKAGVDRVRYWPENEHQESRGDLIWRLVFPNPSTSYRNARQSAMMMHISKSHQSLLYMSQADAALEKTAMTLPRDWNAGSLVVGKCTSLDGLGLIWLTLVDPQKLFLTTRAFERMLMGGDDFVRRVRRNSHAEVIVLDAGGHREISL